VPAFDAEINPSHAVCVGAQPWALNCQCARAKHVSRE